MTHPASRPAAPRGARSRVGRDLAAQADLVDAAAFGLEHLDLDVADIELLAGGRHASEVGDDEPADGLEAVALDVDAETLGRGVDVDLGAEHERAVAHLDDRLGLDVVLVADLARSE